MCLLQHRIHLKLSFNQQQQLQMYSLVLMLQLLGMNQSSYLEPIKNDLKEFDTAIRACEDPISFVDHVISRLSMMKS